ncbi:YccJ family protein [Halobacillus amylolyticus]|uniref:Uncharacterized protein n=1 Tax=Halobacillus amylolyticus TaxID=2932259 RepID=A0ABY4HHN4_9BACI|nr:hypothetical protein [Halobacillus amylolyticus]UOR14086.1 hypothetical protein MUO15_21255 [Halobacillus amylolyticus]
MTSSERGHLIEWLFVITGDNLSLWEQTNDDVLVRLFEKTVEEHGQLGLLHS